MRLTVKQIEIMGILNAGNGIDAGKFSPCDLDQLLERLSYRTTKDSIQFSIRALVKKELVEKKGTEVRRGRSRVLLSLTKSGKAIFSAETEPWMVGEEDTIPGVLLPEID